MNSKHKFYQPPTKAKPVASVLPSATTKTKPNQVKNNAGGYAYTVNDLEALTRFLVLGAAGTYYISGDKVVLENLKAVDRLMEKFTADDFVQVLINMRSRVPSSKTLIAVTAYCMKFGSDELKRIIAGNIGKILWTGDDLFRYVDFCKSFQRGWGRSQTRLINNWYNGRSPEKLAAQLIKYKGRYNWNHKDVMKLGSVVPTDAVHDALYAYTVSRIRGGDHRRDVAWDKINGVVHSSDPESSAFEAMSYVIDYEQMWAFFGDGDVDSALSLAKQNGFPWEGMPSEVLNDWALWDTYLLEDIGPRALLRNLNRLTKMGLVDKPLALCKVIAKFSDPEWLSGSHPASIAIALMQYQKGENLDGSNKWNPIPAIVDVLDTAFVKAYAGHGMGVDAEERVIVAVDVSPSMYGSIADGIGNMRAVDVAALMCGVLVRGEAPGAVIPLKFASCGKDALKSDGGYSYRRDGISRMSIDSSSSFPAIVREIVGNQNTWGGTDCSLPFQWATAKNVFAKAVVVITDSETWAGHNPNAALEDYRRKVNPEAKLIVIATTPNHVTIGDPNDPLSLNVVGFDSASPEIIERFITGKLG